MLVIFVGVVIAIIMIGFSFVTEAVTAWRRSDYSGQAICALVGLLSIICLSAVSVASGLLRDKFVLFALISIVLTVCVWLLADALVRAIYIALHDIGRAV